jgi:hypothetical protein
MLRNSAAKEAHTKNGTIVKYKNGYVVKLNGENKNAKLSEEIIPNQTKRTSFFCESSSGRNRSAGASGRTNTGTSASSSTGSCCGTSTCTCDTKHTTEETTRSKITLAEIRTRQKEKVIESINNGESGLSMASSGENLGRDTTRIKTLKKPLEELTGDETTMSIGDQKEGELKRIGINLKTFKSKKVIG